jgi:hypothetical protein
VTSLGVNVEIQVLQSFSQKYILAVLALRLQLDSMAQQFLTTRLEEGWGISTLPTELTVDLGAAAVSATLISPILTVIDK